MSRLQKRGELGKTEGLLLLLFTGRTTDAPVTLLFFYSGQNPPV